MRDFCCRAGVGTVQPVTPAPLHPAEEPALIWLCVQVTTAVGRWVQPSKACLWFSLWINWKPMKAGTWVPSTSSWYSLPHSSVQLLSRVLLFATPWTAACQASLSITNSWSLLKLMPIEWVMLSNHLILCRPLLLLPSIFCSIGGFSNQSVLRTRWPEYWSFSFSISPSNEYSGLISSRVDWSDLLAVQGTLKRLLQHHSSKASILQHSAFFIVQLAHPSMTTGKLYIHDYWKTTGSVWDPLPPPTELTQHSLLYDQSLQISMYSLCQWCKSIAKSENPKFPILGIHSKGSMVRKMHNNTASSYPRLQGLSHGSVGEEAAYDAGDTDLIPGSRRCPRGGNGHLLWYSGLNNPMDRGA